MSLGSSLVMALLAAPSVFLLFRYRRKGAEQKPAKSEFAGILTSLAVMLFSLFYVMSKGIFF